MTPSTDSAVKSKQKAIPPTRPVTRRPLPMSHQARPASPVMAVSSSENAKTGQVAATYVSQASCPADCPHRGKTCYAERGHVGIHTIRLNKSKLSDPLAVAVKEAEAIDRMAATLDLRLHVVGDCATNDAARVVSDAAGRYVDRAGGRDERLVRVWTYTHAWRNVDRASWGNVSVLASCETVSQAEEAMARGYAVAIIVPEFPSERTFDHHGLKVVPCPEETRGKKCVDCRLCMDDVALKERGLAIGFIPRSNTEKRMLPMLSDGPSDDLPY